MRKILSFLLAFVMLFALAPMTFAATDEVSLYYNVSATKTSNGKVTLSTDYAAYGKTVTVTVKPNYGYALDTVSVYKSGNKNSTLKLTAVKVGTSYSFVMPAYDVKVTVKFKASKTFSDIHTYDYFYQAVKWASDAGIAEGEDGAFLPYETTTRAQMIAFLWRAEGSPAPSKRTCAFGDVVRDSYYDKAVIWATENGYINGTSQTTFSPEEAVTRAQVITILARFNGVSDSGKKSGSGFTDVKMTDYCNNAVAWAKKNGIASGTTNDTFSPDEPCQRCQVLTFLWRNYNK